MTPSFLFLPLSLVVLLVYVGKSWDDDAQEWVTYDLCTESQNLLNVSDEQFKKTIKALDVPTNQFWLELTKEGGHMRLMNGGEKPSGQAEGEPGDEAQKQKARPKKNVMDRELYDVLGIEPEVRFAVVN